MKILKVIHTKNHTSTYNYKDNNASIHTDDRSRSVNGKTKAHRRIWFHEVLRTQQEVRETALCYESLLIPLADQRWFGSMSQVKWHFLMLHLQPSIRYIRLSYYSRPCENSLLNALN